MKICMIMSTPFPPEEGIGNHVSSLSKKLMERGHRVVIATRNPWRRTSKEIVDDIEVFKARFLPVYPFHVYLHGVFLKKQINKLSSGFDVIHVHTPLACTIDPFKPVVSTFHSSLLEDARQLEIVDYKSLATVLQSWSIGRHLILKLIKRSDLVTTVSNSVSCELRRYYKVNHDPVVVGNGVDEKTFTPARFENKKKYVLHVGRLSYRKGLFDFLECARILARRDISFVLIGKGELEQRLRRKVKDAGLRNKITFMGYVNRKNLIQFYQGATAVSISSHYESGPIVLLEAMSCARPVVSTCVGIAPEAIKNFENGILIPPKSPEKMAEAISILSEDKKLRRVLGENARKTILQKYTWDSVTDRVEHCYRSLCDH